MPHYRLDDEFVSSVPPELKKAFDSWKDEFDRNSPDTGPV